MDISRADEDWGLSHLSREVLPELARGWKASALSTPLKALAEDVLYGRALNGQQLDFVRLQSQLESPAEATAEENPPVEPFLRRVQWARLLQLVRGSTVEEWASQVQEQRQRYRSLREQQQLTASQLATLDPQRFHPLAATAGNPWSQRQADEELQEEIWRDIERTYPERALFTQDTTRRSLQRVLFTWAKSNTDISYKQGMNEILAVLHLACAREALSACPAVDPGDPFCILFSADPGDIEADTFRLFDGLMTDCCMRSMYLPPQQDALLPAVKGDFLGSLGASQGPSRGPAQSAVLLRCNRLFSGLLAKADPAVYTHLEGLVAMLKFIRQHLLESDFSSCLRRLLKFPPIESVQCLVALSLAVRQGGIPTFAGDAATSVRSCNTSNIYKCTSRTNPVTKGGTSAALEASRFVQPPPPLTRSVIVNTPQLQKQHPHPQESQKRKDWQMDSSFKWNLDAAASVKPEVPPVSGFLGSHIDAMRQALAAVAEECNDLSNAAAGLLSSVSSDLAALKSVLDGSQYSASVFKLQPQRGTGIFGGSPASVDASDITRMPGTEDASVINGSCSSLAP
ncbi:tbc1 domain family member 5 related protein [Cyclospora cayetanensis]|uniref:Tbc1 domain family member 5 related protein n=1 Tax=Cyclospora cayetanensis TaxID=88456 RepID=A0A1D3D3D3_9EIME|nr:tbc1 domain family member 5 related protein [Cyclospora cayetanensis]